MKKPPKSVAVQVTGEHAVPQILLEEQKATISELKMPHRVCLHLKNMAMTALFRFRPQ